MSNSQGEVIAAFSKKLYNLLSLCFPLFVPFVIRLKCCNYFHLYTSDFGNLSAESLKLQPTIFQILQSSKLSVPTFTNP